MWNFNRLSIRSGCHPARFGQDRTKIDLSVLIRYKTLHVSEEDILDYIAVHRTINNVSERIIQTEMYGQWIQGKSAPTFGLSGPWLVVLEELPHPQEPRWRAG